MKAVAIFPKEKAIRIIEHPEPQITGDNQVKLRILEVGVCGTDKELCTFTYGAPPKGTDYLIIGHECLAEVVEIGSTVTNLKPGDLAVPMVRRPCKSKFCLPCQNLHQDLCISGKYAERGIKDLHGFLTEYIVDEEQYLFKIPNSLKDIGVLLEPLTIAEKGLRSFQTIQKRLLYSRNDKKERALILGAGPVGLLGAMLLLKNSFDTYVYSREQDDSYKSKFLNELGANYFSTKKYSYKKLSQDLDNISLVYEATGSAQLAFNLLQVLGENGVFILTGVPDEKLTAEVAIGKTMRNLVLKNQVILGIVNANALDFNQAISDLSNFEKLWPNYPKKIISNRYSINDTKLKEVLLGQIEGIKNTISIYP